VINGPHKARLFSGEGRMRRERRVCGPGKTDGKKYTVGHKQESRNAGSEGIGQKKWSVGPKKRTRPRDRSEGEAAAQRFPIAEKSRTVGEASVFVF